MRIRSARRWLAALALFTAIGLSVWGLSLLLASETVQAAFPVAVVGSAGQGAANGLPSDTPTGTSTATATFTRTAINTRTITSTRTVTPTPTCSSSGVGAWSVVAPLPLAARNFTMDTDGTYAYAAGGSNVSVGVLDRFSRYDPATNAWATLTPLPIPGIGPFTVYAPNTNKVYVFGGYCCGNAYTDMQIYDVKTGVWSPAHSCPVRGG